jgi:hypothetical protein
MKEEPGQTTIGPRFSKNTQRAKNWNFLLSRTWRIFASFLHSCPALPRTWGANPQNGNAEGKLFVVSFVYIYIYIYNMFAFYKRFCLKYLFQLFVIFILNGKLLELSIKSGKDGTGPPVWSHRGWDFKKQGEKVHWASTGHETQFSSKFGAKLSLPSPFFSWTLSTNYCSFYVYSSYKCSRASCIESWVSVFHTLI